MTQLHPVFVGILESFRIAAAATAAAAAAAAPPTAGTYAQRLQAHDWQFEFADHGPAYESGKRERAALALLQRSLDADGAIWNQHAPICYQLGRIAA